MLADTKLSNSLVAIVGAGPAGLFAARELAAAGVSVALFNRDIQPGGLAEYGIYPDKHKMKAGLRNQFRQILASPDVHYFGNVTVGEKGDLRLADLRKMGFQAILVTAGAQRAKMLGIPGEDLAGYYHAKDLVYHYNLLPPFGRMDFSIGKRVAVVGAGNVMMDVTRYLAEKKKVDEVVCVVRRGPGEVRYDKKELETLGAYIDQADFNAEIERSAPVMLALGQDPQQPVESVRSAAEKALPRASDTRFTFHFMQTPARILGEAGHVAGLEVENNTLVMKNGDVRAVGLGTFGRLDVDTVILAIGNQVDLAIGLPVEGAGFKVSDSPRFPMENTSYEVFDPQAGKTIDDVFVAGWARQASTGLVGLARKDGTNGARVVRAYLDSRVDRTPASLETCVRVMEGLNKRVVDNEAVARLMDVESRRALESGLEEFKFDTNEEMLAAIDEVESRV
jgi:ferredoxin/flavodoxin---NADP+ reductase